MASRSWNGLRRVVDDELDVLLDELAAVALEGPRGVGKTESALRRARIRVTLDEPAVAEALAADPIGLLDRAQLRVPSSCGNVNSIWPRSPVGSAA